MCWYLYRTRLGVITDQEYLNIVKNVNDILRDVIQNSFYRRKTLFSQLNYLFIYCNVFQYFF